MLILKKKFNVTLCPKTINNILEKITKMVIVLGLSITLSFSLFLSPLIWGFVSYDWNVREGMVSDAARDLLVIDLGKSR